MSARWSEQEDVTLRLLAADGLSAGESATVLKRPEGGVYSRAKRLDISFNSAPGDPLRAFLAFDGRLIREDVGGVVGIRWGAAHRCAGSFPAALCERLLSHGVIVPDQDGRTYRRAR